MEYCGVKQDMKILADRKIKSLLVSVLAAATVFAAIAALTAKMELKHALLWVLLSFAGLTVSVILSLYFYFRDQNKIMENAVLQISDYIAGNKDARIACEDEGELYRLFHEVNSLAAILNAHAENEERAKRFLKDAISDISHQLKTPLAALNIYNGILQGETEDQPDLKEFTTLSEQELDRIETLVQNLLKITKLDAGTIVMEKADENVSEMMGYVERHFAYRAGTEGKTLTFSGKDDVVLYCDFDWLIEAVSNLVKNALDHTKSGEMVTVEWRAFASIVQIVVRDNGSGIHPEDLPHIFKRFYRSRFSKDTQGIGLGLALAKAVVEAHNGTVEVDSEWGRGTVFTLDFLIPTKL